MVKRQFYLNLIWSKWRLLKWRYETQSLQTPLKNMEFGNNNLSLPQSDFAKVTESHCVCKPQNTARNSPANHIRKPE